jgi:hypothetical protein
MIQSGINKENHHTVNDTYTNPSELIPENNSKSNTLPKTHVSSEKSNTHFTVRNRKGISPSTKNSTTNSTTGKQSYNDPRACAHVNN